MFLFIQSCIIWLLSDSIQGLPLNSDHSETSLNDIFISVKTTKKFHQSRVVPILDTWYQNAKSSTWFFTDTKDVKIEERIQEKHFIKTSCPSDHSRQSLCCKMEAEIETFLRETDRKWFCHVDDDNYVNVQQLRQTLAKFNPNQDWYLGKVSISKPLQIYDKSQQKEVEFVFGTGGAGFCLSRTVVERIGNLKESFGETGDKIGLPDDVTIGYLVTVRLGVPLTELKEFHSHLEALSRLDSDKNILKQQITFSYGKYEDGTRNYVRVKDLDLSQDQTTFYTLHCVLFDQCLKGQNQKRTKYRNRINTLR